MPSGTTSESPEVVSQLIPGMIIPEIPNIDLPIVITKLYNHCGLCLKIVICLIIITNDSYFKIG
jgi:hypothetical protein